MTQIFPLIKEILQKGIFKSYIPLSYNNVACGKIDKCVYTLLDVGCGNGHPMRAIRRHKRCFTIGVDLFLPNIRKCKTAKLHDGYVFCDARFLPFKEKWFDGVICFEVVEHMPKKNGVEFVKNVEKLARSQVVIGTPVAYSPGGHDEENPFDLHQSRWSPTEFNKMKYEVRGVNGSARVSEILSRISFHVARTYLGVIVPYFSEPFVYFFPNFAWGMIATKKLPRP